MMMIPLHEESGGQERDERLQEEAREGGAAIHAPTRRALDREKRTKRGETI